MIEKLISTKKSNLYTISENTSEYTRNHRMLDGSLKTVLDSEKLNISVSLPVSTCLHLLLASLPLHQKDMNK
ncbi:hypothetical protein, partial [uncultured Microscilla sp.]|uniref:hypothetical protein n=1 Tax=uncultured Microscilla sp. TaxID=432653 RepID=UPI002618CB85